jgi:hypothetical protein
VEVKMRATGERNTRPLGSAAADIVAIVIEQRASFAH